MFHLVTTAGNPYHSMKRVIPSTIQHNLQVRKYALNRMVKKSSWVIDAKEEESLLESAKKVFAREEASSPISSNMFRLQKLLTQRLGFRQIHHQDHPTYPYNRVPFYIHDKQVHRLSPMHPGIMSRIVFKSAANAYGVPWTLKKKKYSTCTATAKVWSGNNLSSSIFPRGIRSGPVRSFWSQSNTQKIDDEILREFQPPPKNPPFLSEEHLREYFKRMGNGAPIYVGHFFILSSALVFLMVVLGGLTRLTESGLSMVS